MKMENRGSIGLSGLFLVCLDCGVGVSMEGVFAKEALKVSGAKAGDRGLVIWTWNAARRRGCSNAVLRTSISR